MGLVGDNTNFFFFKLTVNKWAFCGFICARACCTLLASLFFYHVSTKVVLLPYLFRETLLLLGDYWMEEERKWSGLSGGSNGVCQNCIFLSGIIFPDAVPKPHLSSELVRWSRAFLWPGVSSGFASHKTSFSHSLSDNWQKQTSSYLCDPNKL